MQKEILRVRSYQNVLPIRKKVAAYARVSSGKDSMLHSLSAQISYYSELIQNNPNWQYIGVYADEARTGTKGERPEFQRLLEDCKQGKIDMVITKSVSRFARNTLDTLTITRELKNLGVDVFFERERIHSISPDGELMLTILASFAQEESLSVSENCKWQIRNKFKNGELANLRFLFGYEISKGEIKIDEENAAIVKWIFDHYTNGTGCTKIAKMLREYGVPNIRGGKWTADRVRNIILNEKYKGDALLQKKFVSNHLTKGVKRNHGELPMYYAEGTHEAIVEKEVFEKASEILEANRKKAKTNRQTPKKYIFTGKIKCLNCGKNYKRKVCKGKIYWICATYAEEGKNICNSKQISEEILMSKACEVLGINIFDEKLFAKNIKQILIPNHELLTFVLHDGNEVTLKWENKSRSESCSEEITTPKRRGM